MKQKNRRNDFYIFLALAAILAALLNLEGCSLIRIEEGEREALEYTVAEAADIPEEAASLIEEKKEQEFRLAYQKGDELYLIRGYGRQMTGGYSIQVTELTVSESAVYFGTKLIAPEPEEAGGEPSCPYIVIKTQYRKEPVEFL